MANFSIRRGLKANLPSSRNADTLYFTTDTREFFMGEQSFSMAVRTGGTALPTTFAVGVLYFLANGNGWSHNGTDWVHVIRASEFNDKTIVETIDGDDPDHDNIPTEQAIVEFVEEHVKDTLENLNVAHNVSWNATTYTLTVPMQGRTALTVNLGSLAAGGIKSGFFDDVTNEIVLVLADDTEIRIPAEDLVTVYTSGSVATSTIQVAISSANAITAILRVATSTLLTIDGTTGELTFNDAAITALGTRITALETRATEIESRLTWGTFN